MKRKSERKKYVRRQGNASIYFLLWAAFSLFALVIVLLFGVTQNLMLKQTYKDEVSRSLAVDGKAIQKAITEYRGPNYSAFLRYQASLYNAEVYLLNEEGTVLFPVEEIDPDDPVFSERIDFSEKMDRLISRLESSGDKPVIYEDDSGEFVYGAVYEKIGTEPVYLYISKSLELGESVVSQMKVRVMLMAIFVLILSFAVSSAISGVLTNPITEMTEKARRLAAGDFSVDFHGRSYGSEMQELAETLNFARDEISKSDRMQKELIANVSHDFKTPLTMIKAYASMIQEISGDNPEKRTKHTQVIIEEADRLTSLVNDLLDLSKIRSGIAALKPEVFDLSEYTFDVLEKFAYLSETQGYHFESDIEKDLYTEADPLKIGEVLYNLIGNAVNYTGEDKRVSVRLKTESDGNIRFSVTDTGKGIKPEEIATIWDRYYRSSQAHKRPVQGTGLGLSIVKMILEKHNFRFGVESIVGKGSTFYVIFPSHTPPESKDIEK